MDRAAPLALSSVEARDADEAERLAALEARRPFELATGPLNSGIFPNLLFDSTLGPERLFFYGPDTPEGQMAFRQSPEGVGRLFAAVYSDPYSGEEGVPPAIHRRASGMRRLTMKRDGVSLDTERS